MQTRLFCLSEQTATNPLVYSVREGDKFQVTCNETDTHNKEVFWLGDDAHSAFRQNGTLLKFINVTRDFAGTYICYSKNVTAGEETKVNASVIESVNIDVLCKYIYHMTSRQAKICIRGMRGQQRPR